MNPVSSESHVNTLKVLQNTTKIGEKVIVAYKLAVNTYLGPQNT